MVAQSIAVLPAPITTHFVADPHARRVDLALLDKLETIEDMLFARDAKRWRAPQAHAQEDRIEALAADRRG